MNNIPAFLEDSKQILSKQGFATSDVWYHGTSSALVASIQEKGLQRSGDKAFKDSVKKTMTTIGSSYTQSIEPVFLTPSKELAFYWAEQAIKNRSVYIKGEEEAVVFKVTLPKMLNDRVKPDVGAASLLLTKEGENFMAYLAGIYTVNGFGIPEIDLMKANRLEYLSILGMAYIDVDIEVSRLSLIMNPS